MTEAGSNPTDLSRRALLVGGAAAAGVAGTGALAVTFDEALGLGGEARVLERLVSAVLSVPEGSTWPTPDQVPILDRVEGVLAGLAPEVRDQLRLGLRLFNHSAVVMGLNGRPFVLLSDAAALEHCQAWEQGTPVQASLMHVLRSVVRLSYLRDDATWPAMHYEGPVSAPRRYPRLGNAPLPVEDQAADRAAPTAHPSAETEPANGD